ncbi:kinase-like protein [Rhizoctonia solani]|uniref:Kinase-like protein n=1 Tax=Rhizoctonia solani TaxID=456999 RepID=A0A8H7M699_9AGAM|nr:kinase-like protein [Rhizoctonia solani]
MLSFLLHQQWNRSHFLPLPRLQQTLGWRDDTDNSIAASGPPRPASPAFSVAETTRAGGSSNRQGRSSSGYNIPDQTSINNLVNGFTATLEQLWNQLISTNPEPSHARRNSHSRTRTSSYVSPVPENENRALSSLATQCALTLSEVTKEIAPIPAIGPLCGCLKQVFQAVERSKVNRQGPMEATASRCVMVMRIAGAHVDNYGKEQYPNLDEAAAYCRTLNRIEERARCYNEMSELIASKRVECPAARAHHSIGHEASAAASSLLGKQCNLDAPIPIKTGITCDIYQASFLGGEKVAKKVFRIGMSDKEYVEKYATRFLRIANLWSEFRSDYTLPFYGIGDGVTYGVAADQELLTQYIVPEQYRNNQGMKRGMLRIITDAAKGLQYLHNRDPPVVHSGMRGDNILITDSEGGILGGFGLTKATALESVGNNKIPPVVMTGKTESQRWMAPEMFVDHGAVGASEYG